MTRREELYPEIRRLREDEGLKWREIGARLGLALTTVQVYYSDPTGEADRARKARNNGVCADCGGETFGGGSAVPPRRCRECANPAWSPAAIIEALRDWGEDHGGIPPRATDARPGHEGHGRLPHHGAVKMRFGSWNQGLLAAGYTGLHVDRRPETQTAIEQMIADGTPVREVADRFGVAPNTIYMRLWYRGLRASDLRTAA